MSESAVELTVGGDNENLKAVLKESEKESQKTGDKILKERERQEAKEKQILDRSERDRQRREDRARRDAEKSAQARKKEADDTALQISRISSASDVLTFALDKVGGGLKVAGTAAAAGVLVSGIYEATQAATALDEKLAKLGRKTNGGVWNFGMSDLEASLLEMRQLKDEVVTSRDSNPVGNVINNLYSTLGKYIRSGGKEDASVSDIAGGIQTKQEARLQDLMYTQLNRIGEKSKDISEITKMRLQGQTDLADQAALEAQYAEAIQKARDEGKSAVADQLTDERELKRRLLERQQIINNLSRNATATQAENEAETEGLNVGRSEYDAQAASRERALDAAKNSRDVIKAAATDFPDNIDLQTELRIREAAVKKIAAENAKAARDTRRAQEDSMRATKAEMSAIEASLSGNLRMADVSRERLQNEQAITAALRSGDTALANQLRGLGKMQAKASMTTVVTNSTTAGNPPTPAQIRQQQKADQKQARKTQKSVDRMAADDYITSADRDTSGRITGGWDNSAGQKVKVDKDGNKYTVDPSGKWNFLRGAGESPSSSSGIDQAERRPSDNLKGIDKWHSKNPGKGSPQDRYGNKYSVDKEGRWTMKDDPMEKAAKALSAIDVYKNENSGSTMQAEIEGAQNKVIAQEQMHNAATGKKNPQEKAMSSMGKDITEMRKILASWDV